MLVSIIGLMLQKKVISAWILLENSAPQDYTIDKENKSLQGEARGGMGVPTYPLFSLLCQFSPLGLEGGPYQTRTSNTLKDYAFL